MSNLTHGPLSFTISRLQTTATLEEIVAALVGFRPAYQGLQPGWGSVNDDTDVLGSFGPPPQVGDPFIEPEAGVHPKRVLARLYFWTEDRGARRALSDSARTRDAYRLRSCDLIISKIHDGACLVALTSRNADHLQSRIVPSLKQAFLAADPNSLLQMDDSPLDLVDADVFLWLLQRFASAPELHAGLNLMGIREITSQDVLSRGANLSHGVDLSRRELLALITNKSTRFGPAKITVEYQDANAYLDFELFRDGGFTLHAGASRYAQPLGRAEIGLRSAPDLIYGVIPNLTSGYRADKKWQASERSAFIDLCMDRLRAG